MSFVETKIYLVQIMASEENPENTIYIKFVQPDGMGYVVYASECTCECTTLKWFKFGPNIEPHPLLADPRPAIMLLLETTSTFFEPGQLPEEIKNIAVECMANQHSEPCEGQETQFVDNLWAIHFLRKMNLRGWLSVQAWTRARNLLCSGITDYTRRLAILNLSGVPRTF
ncbi:hypothetical protein KEM56_005325 [Ascosphaera pollenicola]|nr:hypothetical protein KEM56_005325 [Ascosphaera pollenicola]